MELAIPVATHLMSTEVGVGVAVGMGVFVGSGEGVIVGVAVGTKQILVEQFP